MIYFYWKGIEPNGRIIFGQKSARHQKEVLQHLEKLQIIPIQIKRSHLLQKTRTLKTHMLHFIEQLALILNAHVTLNEALITLQSTQKNSSLRFLLKQLQSSIEAGKSLSEAIEPFPQLFDSECRVFIAAGESTGQLRTTLKELSRLKKKQHQLHHHIKKALRYPLFLLLCTLTISTGMLLWVIPKYQTFFFEQNSTLPALTRWLLTLANTLKQLAQPLFYSLLLLGLGGSQLLKSASVKLHLHQALLKTPLIRTLIIHQMLSRWCYLLAIACQTHIPLLSGILLANHTIHNHYLKKQFDIAAERLIGGETLQTCLNDTRIFSPPMLQMILIGENTGTLTEIFKQLATHYENTLTNELATLIQWAEPAMLLFLAALAGLMIAALYLPMIHLGLHL